MAGLLGMHSDEILARFASHEVILPFTEADALRMFIYDLSTSANSNIYLLTLVPISSIFLLFKPRCAANSDV